MHKEEWFDNGKTNLAICILHSNLVLKSVTGNGYGITIKDNKQPSDGTQTMYSGQSR